jgi:hypothetical protein
VKKFGFLAIWCEIGAEHLEDYRNWLTQEHIADRTFSPGFLGVRLFEALNNETSHFILYGTEGPQVLDSPSYRAILDNPSPWTQRIMPKFGLFDRAVGEQSIKLGNGFGPYVVVCRLHTTGSDPDLAQLRDSLGRYLDIPGVVSLRLDAVDKGSSDIKTREKEMRKGSEGDFRFLLCIEAMSEVAVRRAEAVVTGSLDQVFQSLERSDTMSCRMIYGEAAHEGLSMS